MCSPCNPASDPDRETAKLDAPSPTDSSFAHTPAPEGSGEASQTQTLSECKHEIRKISTGYGRTATDSATRHPCRFRGSARAAAAAATAAEEAQAAALAAAALAAEAAQMTALADAATAAAVAQEMALADAATAAEAAKMMALADAAAAAEAAKMMALADAATAAEAAKMMALAEAATAAEAAKMMALAEAATAADAALETALAEAATLAGEDKAEALRLAEAAHMTALANAKTAADDAQAMALAAAKTAADDAQAMALAAAKTAADDAQAMALAAAKTAADAKLMAANDGLVAALQDRGLTPASDTMSVEDQIATNTAALQAELVLITDERNTAQDALFAAGVEKAILEANAAMQTYARLLVTYESIDADAGTAAGLVTAANRAKTEADEALAAAQAGDDVVLTARAQRAVNQADAVVLTADAQLAEAKTTASAMPYAMAIMKQAPAPAGLAASAKRTDNEVEVSVTSDPDKMLIAKVITSVEDDGWYRANVVNEDGDQTATVYTNIENTMMKFNDGSYQYLLYSSHFTDGRSNHWRPDFGS